MFQKQNTFLALRRSCNSWVLFIPCIVARKQPYLLSSHISYVNLTALCNIRQLFASEMVISTVWNYTFMLDSYCHIFIENTNSMIYLANRIAGIVVKIQTLFVQYYCQLKYNYTCVILCTNCLQLWCKKDYGYFNIMIWVRLYQMTYVVKFIYWFFFN